MDLVGIKLGLFTYKGYRKGVFADDKPRSTWVAGVGSGVYLVCFIGSGVYIYIERRREGLQAREKIESYSLLLPIERVDEEI